jgi:hypothetical protein
MSFSILSNLYIGNNISSRLQPSIVIDRIHYCYRQAWRQGPSPELEHRVCHFGWHTGCLRLD